MTTDARNLMIDRRHVPDCVDFRPLTKEIQFVVESSMDDTDPWKVHSWFGCIKGSHGYRRQIHPE